MRKAIILWIIVYLYCFVIFYYSSSPEPGNNIITNKVINTYSIYMHIIEYLILTILVYSAFKNTKFFREYLIPTTMFIMLFAISDEVHQIFVPSRNFSIIDIAADSFSSLLFFSVKRIFK